MMCEDFLRFEADEEASLVERTISELSAEERKSSVTPAVLRKPDRVGE